MDLDLLDYSLPEDAIAQTPSPERDKARMMVLDPERASIGHHMISDLPSLLPPSLIIVNDTRVLPARLFGRKPTGGRVEVLLVERTSEAGNEERWRAMAKPLKGLSPGLKLTLGEGAIEATVGPRLEEGTVELSLRAIDSHEALARALERVGHLPLPPYVRRADDASDRERYQTVFAASDGAVAAPTAGLHFTEALVERLERAGHRFEAITLHVGPGTFRPVVTERVEDHPMHAERYEISEEVVEAVQEARREGRPILAIGTTVVRALEAASEEGALRPGPGRTRLFITPPHRFRVVDLLLTNFHLPRSTLLALVMAFGGVERVREAYRVAVDEGYRFFSYGDAMLLGPLGAGSRR